MKKNYNFGNWTLGKRKNLLPNCKFAIQVHWQSKQPKVLKLIYKFKRLLGYWLKSDMSFVKREACLSVSGGMSLARERGWTRSIKI